MPSLTRVDHEGYSMNISSNQVERWFERKIKCRNDEDMKIQRLDLKR